MSGPKASSYRVDPAVLAERRRRAAARDAYTELAQRHRALTVKQTGRRRRGATPVGFELGTELASVDDASTEAIEGWNARMTGLLDRAETEIATAEHAEQTADLNRRLAAIADESAEQRLQARAAAERRDRARPAPGASERVRRTEAKAQPAATSREKLHAEVTGAIARLRPDVTGAERADIEALAEQVLTEQSSRARSLLVELRVRVQRYNTSAKDRAAGVARARVLRQELNGLSGAVVDQARRLLDSVIAGEATLLDADVERIGRARATAEAEAARAYVAAELAKAFAAAGCQVQEGFATLVLSGDSVYAALADQADHAVEVQLRDEQVHVRVVRAQGSPDANGDTAAEWEFCRRFGVISADIHNRGVEMHLTRHILPGGLPVAQVAAAATVLDSETASAELKTRRIER